MAFHFGKLYFENSLDCVWRQKIGILGKISSVSQKLANMKFYYEYYKFYKKQFGFDDNSRTCLGVSYLRYIKILDYITHLFAGLRVGDFEETELFNQISAQKDVTNFNSIFNDLIEQYKLYGLAKLKVKAAE